MATPGAAWWGDVRLCSLHPTLPAATWEEQNGADPGSCPAWVTTLATESAGHKGQVRSSQKNAFSTHIVRLMVWGRLWDENRGQGGDAIAKVHD